MKSRFYFLMVMTFFVVLLAYLSYQILRPLLVPLSWAIVLSILFYPFFALLVPYLKRRSLAAVITLVLILVVLIVPVFYLSLLLANEVAALSRLIETGRIDMLRDLLQHPAARKVLAEASSLINVPEDEITREIMLNISHFGRQLLAHIARGIGGIIISALGFILMAITLFFILRDAPALLKKIRDYLPFSEEQKDRLMNRANDIVFSTIYGGVVVAVAQGTAGGIVFAVLGFETPVVWGLVMAIASLLPAVGPGIIWLPAAVYLFMNGALIKGSLLVAAGIGIAAIDTFLRPLIIGNRTKMHFLVIFFSVIGGIQLFGLIGFILGPLVLALFVSVLDVFGSTDGGLEPARAEAGPAKV